MNAYDRDKKYDIIWHKKDGYRWITAGQVSVMNSTISYAMSPWTSICSFSVGPWNQFSRTTYWENIWAKAFPVPTKQCQFTLTTEAPVANFFPSFFDASLSFMPATLR